MPYNTINLEREGGLGILTLNRPDRFNAMDAELGQELLAAVIDVSADARVRALLITGAGDAFCSGGDLKAFQDAGEGFETYLETVVAPVHAAVSRLIRMPIPVVTAVNGAAAGGGLSLSMAGDIVLASERAVFTSGYTKIGASPDGSLTVFLTRLVGLRRAQELVFTNRVLDAQQAAEWGLVTRVYAAETFRQEALEFAGELAHGPTFAYGRAKEMLHFGDYNTPQTEMEIEARNIVACARGRDFRNGIRAFAAKEQPTFEGR